MTMPRSGKVLAGVTAQAPVQGVAHMTAQGRVHA